MRCAREVWPGTLATAEQQLKDEYNRRLAAAIEAELAQAEAQNRLVDVPAAVARVRAELGLEDGADPA